LRHPVGATGVKQAVEITLQLRGEAEAADKWREIGLSICRRFSGTAVVHISEGEISMSVQILEKIKESLYLIGTHCEMR